MKAVNYNWFASRADQIGVEATIELAKTLGMAVKVVTMFARLYTGK